jgi:MFS family permease
MNSAAIETGKFYGWKALGVVAVMYFTMTGFLLYSFPVFLPFLCDAFGWSRAAVSWANSLAMIVIGIVSPLAGMFIARYGARRAIVIGNLLCVACFLIAGFHTRLWELYFAYAFLFGVGGCLGGILPMTTIVNNWFIKKRPVALSLLLASGGLGGLVVVQLLMALINKAGWRNAYLVVAGITLLLLVILPALLAKNKPEDLGQSPDGISDKDDSVPSTHSSKSLYSNPVDFTAAEAVRTPALWFLTVFGTAHMFGLQGLLQHQVAFLLDMDIPSTAAATAYSTFVGISVIGRLGIGFLGLKFHIRSLAILSMLILMLGMALMLWTRTLPMVFVYTTIVGLGMGASIVAIMNLIPLYFGRTHYPKIMGYVLPFSTIIGSLGSPLTGWIRDITGSYIQAWEVSIFVLLISLVFLILARPPVHPSLKQPARAN